jgi:beta-N-acetylhexosaminidase
MTGALKLKNLRLFFAPKLFLTFIPLLCCLPLQAGDSLRYKIAQLLVVGFRGTELVGGSHIYDDIKELHVGGVILFDYDAVSKTRGRNITSPAQLRQLCSDLQSLADEKLIISIDQEGGMVNRLKSSAGFPATVSAKYLGLTNNADTTRRYAAQTALLLRELGVNFNFVPCVDVEVNPSCPVIGKVERSFSATPEVVVKHARIWVDEHRRQGVVTVPKHFPGHGSSRSDSHLGFTDVTGTWTKRELIPYRQLLKSGHCDAIMVSHVFNKNLDGRYPATLSKKTVGMIRNDLKFGGLVVSDDMDMGAIADRYSLEAALVLALNAGIDMLVLSNNGKYYDEQLAQKAVSAVYAAVKQGRISEKRISEAYRNVAAVKSRL